MLFIELKLPIFCYNNKEDQLTHGENPQGWEIKFDRMYSSTGNIYIETETYGHIDGIYKKNCNSWIWVIGNYDRFFIFSRKTLQKMHQSGKFRQVVNKYDSSSGFLISDAEAREYAEKVIEVSK